MPWYQFTKHPLDPMMWAFWQKVGCWLPCCSYTSKDCSMKVSTRVYYNFQHKKSKITGFVELLCFLWDFLRCWSTVRVLSQSSSLFAFALVRPICQWSNHIVYDVKGELKCHQACSRTRSNVFLASLDGVLFVLLLVHVLVHVLVLAWQNREWWCSFPMTQVSCCPCTRTIQGRTCII